VRSSEDGKSARLSFVLPSKVRVKVGVRVRVRVRVP